MGVNTIPPDDPRYEIRQADVEQELLMIGRMVKQRMPEGFGFALFIFSLGGPGAMFYLSSADRQDMIRALKEFIAREEAHGPDARDALRDRGGR